MKKIKNPQMKLLKDCVFRAWNNNSYELLQDNGYRANKQFLMVMAMNEAKKLNYKIDSSYFAYHADELLDIVERLYERT